MKWTPAMIARVHQLAPGRYREDLAAELGITLSAMNSAATKFGFRFKRKPYVSARSQPNPKLSAELQREIEAARAEASSAPPFKRPGSR